MQSPDLGLELRTARPVAAPDLRRRVLAVAAREEPPRRRFSLPPLRRVALVAASAALVVAIGGAVVHGLVSPSPARHQVAGSNTKLAPELAPARSAGSKSQAIPIPTPGGLAPKSFSIPNTPTRLQQYGASLQIQVKNRDALSNATKRAMRVARLLGGYVVTVQYAAPRHGQGSASIVVRVPVDRVQDAVEEYSGIGTILDQHVSILDVTKKVNQQTRTIATLERRILVFQHKLADPSLDARQRSRYEELLRFSKARLRLADQSKALTVRRATLARVALELTTQPKAAGAAGSRFRRTMSGAGGVLLREAELLFYALIVAGPLLVLGGALIAAGRMRDRRLFERS
jgi:hypothetical protein